MTKSDPVHADQEENEIWLGNADVNNWPRPYLSCLKTIRLGKQAYDIKGLPIPPNYCLPIFIHKSEYDVYCKIMDDEIRKIRNS